MKILPYDTFKIKSTLSAKKLATALGSIIEPKTLSRAPQKDGAQFKGEIFEDGFKMRRIILYRNSFLPVVTGTFTPNGSGTDIQITMALNTFTAVFMGIWLAVTCYVLYTTYSSPQFTLGALVFGILLTLAGFWWEARKQKPRLIEIFEEIEEAG